MRYIDAEKLKAEIERRLNIVEPNKDTFESAAACRQELIWMKDFITSLQQEQPDIIEHICLSAGISAPFMDGNQWSILKGDNIQVGVVGFGDTKEDALINFIKDVPLPQEQPENPVIHSRYTKVRETKTGRVFLAEYSSEAAEWYEAGTGKAYSISDVEIVKEQPEVAYIFKPNMTLDEMKDSISGLTQEGNRIKEAQEGTLRR